MFETQFGFNSQFNQYELKIDGDKYQVAIEWLRKFGTRFNATRFSRYWLIELIEVSESVIDALYAKFPSTEWEDCGSDDNDEPMTTREFMNLFNLFGYFDNCCTRTEIKAEYRKLVKSMHPDVGGDASEFAELSKQYQSALQLVNA